ncbi:MAG: hypothetical protein FJ087_23560 [Deltaproteobacteria bacterium]|nr:hypothetical protein [Deltaproteobacteria bacterium]
MERHPFRIVASPHARENYEPEALVQSEIAGLNRQGILHPDKHFTWPGGDYLRYHREQVFERRFPGS